MKEFEIKLNTFNDVRDFISLTATFTGNVTLSSGRYIVDGKSIMGLYSLDLSRSIKTKFDGEISEDFYNKLSKFIVKSEDI